MTHVEVAKLQANFCSGHFSGFEGRKCLRDLDSTRRILIGELGQSEGLCDRSPPCLSVASGALPPFLSSADSLGDLPELTPFLWHLEPRV